MVDNREILLVFDRRLSELETKLVDIEATLDDLTKNVHPQSEYKINRSAHRKVHKSDTLSNIFKLQSEKKILPKPIHRYTKPALMTIKSKTEIPSTDPLDIRSKIMMVPTTSKKKVNETLSNSISKRENNQFPASNDLYEEMKDSLPEEGLESLVNEFDKCIKTESLSEEMPHQTSSSVKESYGLVIEESDD